MDSADSQSEEEEEEENGSDGTDTGTATRYTGISDLVESEKCVDTSDDTSAHPNVVSITPINPDSGGAPDADPEQSP